MSGARPFRAPHHSASMPALVGGGLKVRPGEVSLAHLGVLFLDELPEFQRAVLDRCASRSRPARSAWRAPTAHVTFPARVQLVAAMNPCRCGHLGDPALACARAPRCAADYQAQGVGAAARPDRPACRGRRRSAPPTCPCRRPPRDRPRSPRGWRRRAHVQTARYAGHGPRTNAEADGELLDASRHARRAGPQAARRKPPRRCGCRRAAITASCASPAPSPIWPGAEAVGRIHVAEALSYRRPRRATERARLGIVVSRSLARAAAFSYEAARAPVAEW